MPLLLKLLLVCTALGAALFDLRLRRIPNWLNIAGVVLGLCVNTYLWAGRGALDSVLGLLLALAIYTPLYALRGMGAGDVKLMAAIGAIAGPGNWLTIFLSTALLGGAVSVLLVVRRKRLRETLRNVSTIVDSILRRRSPVQACPELDIRSENALKLPHGAVIGAGVLLFLLINPGSY
jgi:prepilin peptidase CpaA